MVLTGLLLHPIIAMGDVMLWVVTQSALLRPRRALVIAGVVAASLLVAAGTMRSGGRYAGANAPSTGRIPACR